MNKSLKAERASLAVVVDKPLTLSEQYSKAVSQKGFFVEVARLNGMTEMEADNLRMRAALRQIQREMQTGRNTTLSTLEAIKKALI